MFEDYTNVNLANYNPYDDGTVQYENGEDDGQKEHEVGLEGVAYTYTRGTEQEDPAISLQGEGRY